MLSKITSVAVVGLEAIPITVEVDISSQGLPHFIIVGLPDKSVDEAKERVKSAIKNSGYEFPNKKITVNLAPGDVPKEGPGFDIPIALGILASSEQLQKDFSSTLVYGELSLDGTIRPCPGSVLYAILAKEKNYAHLYVPFDNAREAALIQGPIIYACKTLHDLVDHITHQKQLIPESQTQLNFYSAETYTSNMSDIYGQHQVKRAMEISAAGSHNLIMIGSPGSGKTLLSRTFPTILPQLTEEEAIELTKLYSISGKLDGQTPIITSRPFRHPHHTGSVSSIIGGGSSPKPGEISLAHRGVLFLDEFLEFPKLVLESLRQPLEDGQITVSRTASTVTFPAKFILIAACNPCPCGYAYSTEEGKKCSCAPAQVQRYQKKLSGPILDRIDLQVKVRAVPISELSERKKAENSDDIRARIQKARDIQTQRFHKTTTKTNAEMTSYEVKKYCELQPDAQQLLKQAVSKMHLSARAYNRTLKVSRTIADLAQEDTIKASHVAESLQYRFSEIN